MVLDTVIHTVRDSCEFESLGSGPVLAYYAVPPAFLVPIGQSLLLGLLSSPKSPVRILFSTCESKIDS
jgi:hypothetical protein